MTDEPTRTERPGITAGYGIADDAEGLLPWAWARERLERSPNYWVATTREDGAPHVAPVWGVFVDGAVWFGTDPASLKGRNLDRDGRVVVHLESGDETVIVRGTAEPHVARDVEDGLAARIDDAFASKYRNGETGEPFRLLELAPDATVWRVPPVTVLGWREEDYPRSATRWCFDT